MNKQKLVIVLGMHRSGTSTIARGLQVLGAELGDNLVVQQDDNIKGFWEDSDFKILNQDMLRALGRDWHSVSLLSDVGLFERLSEFHWRALELLRVKMEGLSCFGLKDPRACLLMPFWKKIIQQANIEVSYVVALRHPLSVARSLQDRNGFSIEKSFYLWVGHVLSAVVAVRDEATVVVDYDLLLEKPRAELSRIANHLDLDEPVSEELAVYEGQYLEATLRHTCYQPEDLEYTDWAFPELIGTYCLLCELATDQLRLAEPDVKEQLTSLKVQFDQQHFLLAYADQCELNLVDMNARLAASEKGIHKQAKDIQLASEAIRKRDDKLKSLKDKMSAAVKQRDEKLQSLKDEMSVVFKQRDEKLNNLKDEMSVAVKQRDEKLQSLKDEMSAAVKQRDEKLNNLKDEMSVAVKQRNNKLKSMEAGVRQRDSKLIKLNQQIKKLQLKATEDIRSFELHKKNLMAEHRSLADQQKKLRSKVEVLSQLNQQLQQSPGWLVEQKARRLFDKKRLERVSKLLKPKAAGNVLAVPVTTTVQNEPLQSQEEMQLTHEAALLQQSGLFNAQYYLQCYPDVEKAGVDPLRHYLMHGAWEGRNPHPLFANGWYLKANPDIAKAKVNPLLHYLQFGAAENRAPHPFFSGKNYKERYPDVMLSEQNPLAHYLTVGMGECYEPHFLFNTRHYLAAHPELENDKALAYVDCLKRFEGNQRKCFGALAADASVHLDFDWGQQQRFIEGVRRRRLLGQGDMSAPLVSIVMATRDRRSQIGVAIDSILAQTWTNWELLIVDDGSEDDTVSFVHQHYADPRIHIQYIEPAGVSHARNVGLAQAQGEWIAYLDSDNQWFSCFLEIMQAYVAQQGADFAYSAIRLLQDKGIAYRYHEFVADDLLVKNYIDLNSIFHHRDLYDKVGEFDTALPRTVDWDLIIRYTRQANKVVHVPFVGADYDDRQSVNRITVREFNAWRFVVTNKNAIDWPLAKQQVVEQGLVSVIVPVLGSLAEITRCIEALLAANQDDAYQIVLVDTGSNQDVLDLLTFVATSRATVKHVLYRGAQTLALAHNFGATQADGEYLVFLDPLVEVMSEWLQPLLDTMVKQDCGAVQPKILAADGRVHQVGTVFSGQSVLGYSLYAGMPSYAACVNKARAYQALDSGCLLVRRVDFLRLDGFYALYINNLETMDFCLQLTAAGSECWSAPTACVISHRRQKNTEHLLQNRRVFSQRWAEHVKPDDLHYYQQDGFAVSGWVTDGLQPSELALYQPLLQQTPSMRSDKSAGVIKCSDNKPLFALKVPCPNEKEKHEWGDYHFACSLGAALKRQGYDFRIDLRDQWEARSKVAANEVNLLLRGRGELPLRGDQLNLMWLISHPDRTSLDELRRYDHVFVASSVYTDYLHETLESPYKEKVSCLLQCTDPGVFYPGAKEKELMHDVLFVGNSRNQYRDAVRLAIESGLKPAVYGSRWKQFIPDKLIKGENIPNVDLGRYYRSAGVILNDHWPDMREKGFVSNRIFDVLACGGVLVSDEIGGLTKNLLPGVQFFDGDSMESFRSTVVASQASDVFLRQQCFTRALYVHEKHSFDVRAANIVSLVKGLL